MTSVFISYSRTDQPFVRKLFDALAAAGRDAWVDWEGIPPGAEWLKEIYGAIDSADTFIFILSPDSVASEVCGMEVTHAIENRKRLIVIACRPVSVPDVKAKPPLAPLAALNWIWMRETDDFARAFDQVRFALDTDLAYWHLSSRLLVRAREWASNEKNANLTLRGPELLDAERWLASGADKEPRPTALQLDYITSSRKTAAARQRRLLTGVSVALIITLALAVISTSLYGLTQAQNTTIRTKNGQLQQQNTALQAKALAGQANADVVADNLDQALLLGVEGARRLSSYDTRNALFSAIEASPYLDTILQGGNTHPSTAEFVRSVAFSADSQTLLSATSTGHITLWDMTTRRPRSQFTIAPCVTQAPLAYSVTSTAFSPDGQMVAVSARNCASAEIELLNSTTGAVLAHLAIPAHLPLAFLNGHELAFSPASDLLAAGVCADPQCSAAQIMLWDTHSGQPVATFPFNSPAAFVGVWFTPDGSTLVSDTMPHCCSETRVDVWQIATGALTGSWQNDPQQLAEGYTGALSGDGQTLALVGYSSAAGSEVVDLIDVPTQTLKSTIIAPDAGVSTGLSLSNDGGTLVTSGLGTSLQLWNTANRSAIGAPLLGHTAFISQVGFSADGKYFASAGYDDRVLLWRTAPGAIPAPSLTHNSSALTPTLFMPDKTSALTLTDDNQVVRWSLATGQPLDRWRPDLSSSRVHATAMALSSDGKTLAIGDSGNVVTLWNVASHTIIGQPFNGPGGADVTAHLAFSADGRYLVEVTQSSAGALWDIQAHQVVKTFPQVNMLALSPDSALLAVAPRGASQQPVRFYDVRAGQFRQPLSAPTQEVAFLAFSPDGKSLATMNSGGIVTLWNLATGAAGDHFTVGTTPYTIDFRVTFSPDGTLLAATDSQTLTIWDVRNHQLFVRPIFDSIGIQSINFSPDGSLLDESQEFSADILRATTVSAWEAQACAIANRNLTHAEWTQFIGTAPYQKTCPDQPAGA